MKNTIAVSLIFLGTVPTAIGCNDEPSAPDQSSDQPDGASAGGAAGSGTRAGSGGSAGVSTAGSSGASGKAGAGGAAGNALDAGTEDVGVGDDAGGMDASAVDDAISEPVSFDDGSFPPNATIGSCDPLNWITTASSSAANNPPTNAVDGLPATRWSTGIGQGLGEYYQVDFNGYVQLSQITLDNTGSPGDHPRGYDVQTSQDGVDFSNVIASGMQSDTAPPNNVVTIDFAPRAVRYLRIQLTASSGSWWSIHDLAFACQLPGSDGGWTTDQPPNDGLCGASLAGRPDAGGADGAVADGSGMDEGGILDASDAMSRDDAGLDASPADVGTANPFDRSRWMASASSTSTNAGDAVGNAIDGNIATRWSSGRAQAGNEFFKIDLGSVGCVGQVRLVASGTDFAAAYTVAVSIDDLTYITVAKGLGSNVMQIALRPRLARFVRINQVGTSASWWSIDELAVLP